MRDFVVHIAEVSLIQILTAEASGALFAVHLQSHCHLSKSEWDEVPFPCSETRAHTCVHDESLVDVEEHLTLRIRVPDLNSLEREETVTCGDVWGDCLGQDFSMKCCHIRTYAWVPPFVRTCRKRSPLGTLQPGRAPSTRRVGDPWLSKAACPEDPPGEAPSLPPASGSTTQPFQPTERPAGRPRAATRGGGHQGAEGDRTACVCALAEHAPAAAGPPGGR